MKADQERVKTLLTDTVTLLCKNGLHFSEELKVQGLLGITLDNNDVFVVHINEIFKGLVGAQVSGVHAEETSAIAAADSATSDLNLKSKKNISQKYSSSGLVGSAKRKAWSRVASPAVKVKKEVVDEDLVIIDSKCFDHGDFNTDDLSGDGDREAMRKSYGEITQPQQSVPPPKWRVPDSASESFVDSQSQLSGTFSTCLMKSDSSKPADDALGDSSLDESQLSGIGQLSNEGQLTYDSAPGCSGWESQVPGPSQVTAGESGSQDSEAFHPYAGPNLQTDIGCITTTPSSAIQMSHPPRNPNPADAGYNRHNSYCDVKYLGTGDPSSLLTLERLLPPIRRRRSTAVVERAFVCGYPGCHLKFCFKKNMLRHQTYKHGRNKTK